MTSVFPGNKQRTVLMHWKKSQREADKARMILILMTNDRILALYYLYYFSSLLRNPVGGVPGDI